MIRFLFIFLALAEIALGASRLGPRMRVGPLIVDTYNPPLSSLTSGLVEYWKFDEGTGLNRTGIVSGHILTNINNVSTTTGKFGSASSFLSTSSQYLAGGTNVDFQLGNRQAFTIAGWVNTAGGTVGICGKYGGGTNGGKQEFYYRVEGSDFNFRFVSGDAGGGGIKATNVLQASQWNFFAVAYDPDTRLMKMRVNSYVTNETIANIVFNSSNGAFWVGNIPQVNSYMNGKIDSLGIWKRVLTDAELNTLYTGDASTGVWPFGRFPAPVIEVFSPESYQIVQRDGSNQGSINIAGALRNISDSLEARWNGGIWYSIATSKGLFNYTLSNQLAGQGALEFRLANYTNTASVAHVGVGDVFMIAGQSNASGRGTNRYEYAHATLHGGLFGNDYRWHRLVDATDTNFVDSLGRNPVNMDAVSSESDAGGSVWPLLASYIMTNQSVPVAFVAAAKGSSYIEQWQPRANHYDRSTLYGSMAYKALTVGGVKAVLWWQGESEGITNVTQAQYYEWLTNLTYNIRQDLGAKTMVVILQNATRAIDTNKANVYNAQLQAIANDTNTIAGPDFHLRDADDGVHFNYEDSFVNYATPLFWQAFQAAFYP